MIEIDPTSKQHHDFRLLFADYPYLHGLVCGILSGEFGQAFSDREVGASVGMLCDDEFIFFAGEAGGPTAIEMISSRVSGDLLIPATEEWRDAVLKVWGDQLQLRHRIAFKQPARWDRSRLDRLMNDLPAGMLLKQISSEDELRFANLAESLVEIDPVSGQVSLANGIGFGVEFEGSFISGCSGFPAGGMVEFEVQTHPDHRRRGLATAASTALIDYCLTHNLNPCWDAANTMSAELALKLGFTNSTRYEAYKIK